MDIYELPQIFMNFAEKECKGSSLLYEHLSIMIAKEETLLDICRSAKEGQPIPNLLYGAVHTLLLKGSEHPLKEYYPSLIANPKSYKDAFDPFKDFCLTYRNEIEVIMRSRLVQTNEVRRCAYLYPVFCMIYEKLNRPLALIEIGTSAGLQLLWDRYSYSYGQNKVYGNKESKLVIKAEIKGEHFPILHMTPPPVSNRIGFDLNTIDLTDEDEYFWLKSLIWPEHKERFSLFEEAAEYARDESLNLIEGNGVYLLPHYVDYIPDKSVICIFHTHVANQMPVEMRKLLMQTVDTIGKKRDVFHIYNNIQDRNLHLDYYVDGILRQYTIAETDGHGRWFSWLIKD